MMFHQMMLYGRAEEMARLARLVAGPGGALTLTGPPGIGRTALLDAAAGRATVPVLRVAGVESEQDIAGAGLDRLGVDVTAVGPVLCLVDDVDLLDRSSVEVLVHHARRCSGSGLTIVFAGHTPLSGIDSVALPALDDTAADQLLAAATGLPAEIRAGLLEIAHGVPGHLLELAACVDPHHPPDRPLSAVLPPGGPARTTLARAYARLSPGARLATLHAACGGRIEAMAEDPTTENNRAQAVNDTAQTGLTDDKPPPATAEATPHTTCANTANDTTEATPHASHARTTDGTHVNLIDTGDRAPSPATTVQATPHTSRAHAVNAAIHAGLIDADDRTPPPATTVQTTPYTSRAHAVNAAVHAGLIGTDGRAPSPAVAATVRAEAGPRACRAVHAALADTETDRARALCHRAAAAPGTVTGTALAAAARTADPATAARALRQAAALTLDPRTRARRLTDAAAAAWASGRPARARADLAAAWTDPADLAGEIALLRGEIELRDGDPAIAAHDLAAAGGLLPDARRRAVALMLAGEARRMAGDVTGHAATARDLAALGSAEPLAAAHGAGLAATFAGRHTAALSPLRHAADLGSHTRDPRRLVWAGEVALTLGQITLAYDYATAAVGHARTDAPTLLPTALAHLAVVALAADRVAIAITAATEGRAASAGQRNVAAEHAVLLALAAVSLGDRATALARLAEAAPRIADHGLGRPAAYAAWARACVDLLDDRPDDALSRLRTMATGVGRAHPGIRALAVPQLVEAAVRCGEPALAARALTRFDAWATSLRGHSWRALSHRCHALLAPDPATAADHYDRAITLHRRAGATLELARTHLLYAHSLRRDRHPSAARVHLREALHLFHTHGATYWEDRVRTELRAAAPSPAVGGLTPQQTQIARLVADGETNREIARRLVLSPRTVDHHLRNIYTRLGIRSRTELATLVTRAG